MVLTTMSNKLFRSLRYCGSFRQLSHVRIRPRTICLAAPFDLRRRQERLLSHHSPFPYPDIPTTEAAKNFVIHLDENGRSLLLEELKQFQEAADKASGKCRLYMSVVFIYDHVIELSLFLGCTLTSPHPSLSLTDFGQLIKY